MKSIPTGRVISKDGTRIAFDTMGEGDAVIFVCPALADRSVFLPLAKETAETHQRWRPVGEAIWWSTS